MSFVLSPSKEAVGDGGNGIGPSPATFTRDPAAIEQPGPVDNAPELAVEPRPVIETPANAAKASMPAVLGEVEPKADVTPPNASKLNCIVSADADGVRTPPDSIFKGKRGEGEKEGEEKRQSV